MKTLLLFLTLALSALSTKGQMMLATPGVTFKPWVTYWRFDDTGMLYFDGEPHVEVSVGWNDPKGDGVEWYFTFSDDGGQTWRWPYWGGGNRSPVTNPRKWTSLDISIPNFQYRMEAWPE